MCSPTSFTSFDNPSSSITHAAPHTTTNALPSCVPRDEICISTYNLAAGNLPIAILNHSLRVFRYAVHFARRQVPLYSHEGDFTPHRHSLLFVACILHDIGCSSRFDGPQRFEVEGADAAKAQVLSLGHSQDDAHDVWVAIACHTSAHIAEKISPLAYLVRVSVLFDFMETRKLSSEPQTEENSVQVLSEALRREVELEFPRLEPEKVLADVVVEQARKQKGKAPAASWPGILLRAAEENPGWEGINKAF